MKSLVAYLAESVDNPARAFVIIKPGFFKYAQEILKRFTNSGWQVEQQRTKKLLMSEAKRLYKIHKKEDFYKDLCEYMSSDLTTAFILKNTKYEPSQEALDDVTSIKDRLRADYGVTDMKNVIHSSDTLQHMEEESCIYFQIL